MMMRLNLIFKTVSAFVLSAVLISSSGCEDDACIETDWGTTIVVGFIMEAEISGPNGSEFLGREVEFRIYKEPCGQPPKGHQGGTGIASGTGHVNAPVYAGYNLDNAADLVVVSATFADGNNPSQTKTQTFSGANLANWDGNTKRVKFYFNL